MSVHIDALAAKIDAVNTVHRAGIERAPAMLEALRPFVGCKVLKVDGSLMKAVRAALPEIPSTPALSGHYTTGHGYSIAACFKASTCYADEKARRQDYRITQYADATVYLGELSNGVLIKLANPYVARTDYTRQEIEHARMMLKAARNTISEWESKLFHFGEYDR